MSILLPRLISGALAAGTWRDPGSAGLRRALGDYPGLPDLHLFEQPEIMSDVARQLDASGYVDDPEFCLTRAADLSEAGDDDRLVFDSALFIAGSVIPGDDVFVTLDLRSDHENPPVLVLDWTRPIPGRWVPVMRLNALVTGLTELST